MAERRDQMTGASLAMQKLADHFEAQGEMLSLVVPELDNLQIFYKPMTLTQQRALMRAGAMEGDPKSLAKALCLRSLDEDGNRLFNAADEKLMMTKADPQLLLRIVTEMDGDPEDFTVDRARGN